VHVDKGYSCRTSTVAVVCWLWAGAFSGILAGSGLVEAIVWVGWKLNLNGAWFTLTVFISSALFATSVGTGLGTIVGFTAVMYPAGIVLGANPAALLGAIFSGAAFGDNLAPISDTTIVSAATQETDVGGVVRSRLKYVLIASAISAVLFVIFGGGQFMMMEYKSESPMGQFTGSGAYTLDETGGIQAFWIDSMRDMGKGKGMREGDVMTMNWESKMGKGTHVTTKVSDDKLAGTSKWEMPDGMVMEGKTEMTRVKEMTEKN